jgi:ribosomal protein S18 acetylase RimI-like enzyme
MFTPSVIAASALDRDRSMATLVTAFTADPLIRWLFPDAHRFLSYFPQFNNYFGGSAFDHNSAYRSDDFSATALWLPPGAGPDEEALGAVIAEGVDGRRQEEVFAVFEQVKASHPGVAHWYLPVIGVDPLRQGKGYGSALLAHGLAVCDRSHIAAYLEATKPENIPFYKRFGFEVVKTIQVDSSPPITPMFRTAR